MTCPECRCDFTPTEYLRFCDTCGAQLERRFDELQEFRAGVLGLMELASRVVWGESGKVGPVWRVG
jgi:hypothetical protein